MNMIMMKQSTAKKIAKHLHTEHTELYISSKEALDLNT